MCIKSTPGNYSKCPFLKSNQTLRGDVTREDSLRLFLAQHSIAMLEQSFETVVSNNVATMLQRCVALKIVVAIKEVLLRQKLDFQIQSTPDNSNLQEKSKKVRVIESSKKIAKSKVRNSFSLYSEIQHFNHIL